MEITSSVIKAFNKEDYCPRKIHSRYVLGEESDLSNETLMSGTFFESIVTFYNTDDPNGNMLKMDAFLSKMTINYNDIEATAVLYEQGIRFVIGDYNVPEHLIKKRIKNKYGVDTWTTELVRIYYQAARVYFELNTYKFFDNPFFVHTRLSAKWNKNENVTISGELDMFGFLMKNNLPVPTVIDLKLTGSVRNEFGPFCWGTPHLMDHTQAAMYHKIYRLVNNSPCDFMYMVYDKKPNPESKHLNKEYTILEDTELDEAIRKAYDLYIENEILGWHENPSYNACKSCMLKDKCLSYMESPPKLPIINI